MITKKFLKDLASYAPSKFLPAITAFITTPILTRLFLPEEYGQWSIAINVSTFLSAFAVSGFGSAVLRFYPSYERKKQLNIFLSTILTSVVIILIVISGLILIVLSGIKSFLPSTLVELTPIILAIYITQSILSIFLALIRAQERSGLFTFFQLFNYYGSLGIGLFCVIVRGLGIYGLLLGTLIIYFFSLPLLVFFSTKGMRFKIQDFQISDAREIWDYSWPLIISNLAMWGLRVSDLYIINLFWSELEVGIYSVSYNISSKSIELLVTLFLLSVSPYLYRTWESNGREATEKALTMVTRYYVVFCLPAAVGITALSFPFIQLLTSPNYFDGNKIVVFIVFSSFIWGLSHIAMMGLTINKQPRSHATNTAISALLHICIQLIFVPRFGYIASAISTLLSFLTLLLLHNIASHPYLSWNFPVTTYGKVIISCLIMGIIANGAYQLTNKEGGISILILLLSIMIAVIAYFCCLWLFGELHDSEKEIVSRVWFRLFRKKSTKN